MCDIEICIECSHSQVPRLKLNICLLNYKKYLMISAMRNFVVVECYWPTLIFVFTVNTRLKIKDYLMIVGVKI